MNAAYRRMEIVSILVVSGHITAKELAQEFGVCIRTIRNDITLLSYGYPIYTKPGQAGEDGLLYCGKYPDGIVTHYISGDLKPEVRAKIETKIKAEDEEKAKRKDSIGNLLRKRQRNGKWK